MADKGQPDSDTAAQALRGLKILTAPAPRPTGRRPYAPKPPPVDGLTDAVWEAYQLPDNHPEKYRIIPVPPEHAEQVRAWLLQAKNWLNWKHGADIRGLDKKDVQILERDLVPDLAVRKNIPKGMVGVWFTARKPMNKGMRARQAKLARGQERSDEITAHRRRAGR